MKAPARAKAVEPKHHPEVLVIGPADPKDVTFMLLVDMMAEYGIYMEADDKDQFPKTLPRDLTRYKGIVIDQALPVAKEFEKHPDAAAVKERLVAYRKPTDFNWNDQRNIWVYCHRLLMRLNVTPQHETFLQRGAARRDKDVILGQVHACWEREPVWLRYGNDVSFVWLGGMWRTAEVYKDRDVEAKVVSAANDIADMCEAGTLPCAKGQKGKLYCADLFLTIWRKTKNERLLRLARQNMDTLAEARKRAKRYRSEAIYMCAETISGPPWYWAMMGDWFDEPGYFQPAADFMKAGFEALFDHRRMLWAHYGRKGICRGLPWGRGQGWSMYGLVGLLEHLPKSHPDYPLFASWVDMTAEGMRRAQDPATGMWRNVMGEPATRLEVSGTAHAIQHLCRAWRIGACTAPFVPEMLARAWRGIKAHTFRQRTCTFAWGTNEGYDIGFYNTIPCGGSFAYSFLAGSEYVKTFGPLVE